MTFNTDAGKDDLPKVSIIIVTFNAAATLQKCLDSIYRQTYPFLDIIVIDGASKDKTVEILKLNTEKISYWESEPDKGIYDAMNKALAHIKGEWVYFLGADDELFDDFSKLLYKLKDKATVYYGQALRKNKLIPEGEVTAYRHAKDTICHQAIVYPVSVFKKYKYSSKYPITADHLLNMQVWADKKYHFEFVNLAIANFNYTGVSSLNEDIKFKRDQAYLILKYHGPLIWFRYVFRKFKEKLNPDKYKVEEEG
jgi:glycosyltransferase involved in cell wall biosynthesis